MQKYPAFTTIYPQMGNLEANKHLLYGLAL